MSHDHSKPYFEDTYLIISSSAIIHKGERIPVKSIKKVYAENDDGPFGLLAAFVTPSYVKIVVEIGILKRKRVIFRELAAWDIEFAVAVLSRSNVYSVSPKADFEWLKQKYSEGHTTIESLRALTGANQQAINEIDEALANNQKQQEIIEAVKKAMASC